MRKEFSASTLTIAIWSCVVLGHVGCGTTQAPLAEQQWSDGERPQQGIPCVNEWQRSDGCAPRSGTHVPRDLTGVWSRFKGGGTMGNFDKFTSKGRQLFDANIPVSGPRAVASALSNDPVMTCDPLGLTRHIFTEVGGRSMEFVQLPDRIIQFFEWAHDFRVIWLDGRQLPIDPEPKWMGYSVGRWEGDTLIVDTVGLMERAWLDHAGQPGSADARVQERYRRPTYETLEMQVTVTAPSIYTEPYVSDTRVHILNVEKSMDEKLDTHCSPTEEQDFNRSIRDPAAGIVR